MTPGELTNLRRTYADICRGYSETSWRGKPVYVAHLSIFDQTEVDVLYDEALEEASCKGIKTEEERLKDLEKRGVWTRENESLLNGQKVYVEGMEKTKSKLALKYQIEDMDRQITQGKKELDEMLNKRARAIGLTAERVAEERTQYEYVRILFCKDRTLKERLFTQEEMNELDTDESRELLFLYIDTISRFSIENIKLIAIQPFFLNPLGLVSEQLCEFFGVPMVDLTLYQTNLLIYGQYYHSIFTNHDIPKEMMSTPEKIDEFINRSKNLKAMNAKAGQHQGGFVGYVGAQAEDFKIMGAEDGTSKMHKAANKQYRDGKDAAQGMGYTIVDKA